MSATDAPLLDYASPPARSSERILGYDLARALAICGMILVHFGLVMGGEKPSPSWAAFVLRALDGRPAALFVMLAGVGIALRSSRAAGDAAAGPRRVLVRRGLLLLVVGFVNLTIWPGDILRVYGVSLILAAFLLRAPGRTLLLLAAIFELAFIALFLCVDYERHWDWSTMTYHGLWTAGGVVRNLFYDGFRSVFPWTGLLLFGMWLGRHDVTSRDTRRRMLAWGVGVALVAECTSALLIRAWRAHPVGGVDEPTIRALVGTESMPPLPLFLLAAGGMAVALMAVCLTLAQRSPGLLPVRALVATGQMAFTWYVVHILLGLGSIVAMGWDKANSTPAGLASGLAFFTLAVAASLVWKRHARHGPLEAMMRKIAG
jgi:uncharacterized membrane protein YeiB